MHDDFLPSFHPSSGSNPFPFPAPQHYNFWVVSSWLATLSIDSLVSGPSLFALPFHLQQQHAERAILAASRLDSISQLPDFAASHEWATDGCCLDFS